MASQYILRGYPTPFVLAGTEVGQYAVRGGVVNDPVNLATATLAVTQANQTVAAAGSPVVGGTLSVSEPADTFAAAGGSVVGGTLSVSEPADTIAATATAVQPAGTLNVSEANDTIVAAGGPAPPQVLLPVLYSETGRKQGIPALV